MPISRLQEEHKDWDARGPELSKWMEANGVRVDRARIPEWLAKEKAADELGAASSKKGKP